MAPVDCQMSTTYLTLTRYYTHLPSSSDVFNSSVEALETDMFSSSDLLPLETAASNDTLDSGTCSQGLNTSRQSVFTDELQPCNGTTRRRSRDSSFEDERPSESNSHSPPLTHDMSDVELCEKFCRLTCGCKKANGKPCSTLFPPEHFCDIRTQAALLDHEQLDVILMGSLMATVLERENVVDGRHKPIKRLKAHSSHMHHGYKVCKKTYSFLYGVGVNCRLQSIKSHYLEEGLIERVHKNTNRLPLHAFSYDDVKQLVKFLENYAKQSAILLPGRIPGYKCDGMKLLPCSESKRVSII